MSFEDYAHHILQKHKLSVSIAILKTKPKNISTIQYLEQLISKYKNKMDDDDVTLISDDTDDISVCSDDFHFDESDFNNSETILRDFESDFGGRMEVDEVNGNDGFVTEKELQESYHLPDNLSQTTYCESQDLKKDFNTTNIVENVTFFDTNENGHNIGNKPYNDVNMAQSEYPGSKSFNDESHNDVNIAQNYHSNSKQSSKESYSGDCTAPNNYAGLESMNNQQNIDSNMAQNYYTGSILFNDQQNINGTMIQNDYTPLIPAKKSSGVCTNQNEYTCSKTVNIEYNKVINMAQNENTGLKLDNNITTAQEDIIIIINNNAHKNIPNALKTFSTDHETDNNYKNFSNNKFTEANTQNTQETVLYSHGYTQNCTHYSQSQINMSIPKNLLYRHEYDHTKTTLETDNNNIIDANNTKNNNNAQETTEILINNNRNSNNNTNLRNNNFISLNNIEKDSVVTENGNEPTKSDNFRHFSRDISEYFNEMHDIHEVNNLNTTIIDISNNQETELTEFDIINEIQENPYHFEIITQNLSQNSDKDQKRIEINDTDLTSDINERNSNNNTKDIDNNQQLLLINENLDQNTRNSDNNTENEDNNQQLLIINEHEIDTEDDASQVVSFKILEELNKIKKFLNRDRFSRGGSSDGYSTDTGYKSDSQIRSSNKTALQQSGTSINQSAHSLYNYLTECHLAAATRDITYEIAHVFGQLIDRLHEEEKYPSFLEDLLETVDTILEKICTGNNTQDSEFLQKEENIERIYLLNKSIHLQRHTIEKITIILNNFHSKITEKNYTYELTNINETENITYIFHILEFLLKKYIKNKENFKNFSQSSQNSQEDQKIFKKSLITDIWKKKWNPDYKNKEFFNDNKEKKCVLKFCIDILNKIIVDCLNEYSLVAYSALKCFNIIQS